MRVRRCTVYFYNVKRRKKIDELKNRNLLIIMVWSFFFSSFDCYYYLLLELSLDVKQ